MKHFFGSLLALQIILFVAPSVKAGSSSDNQPTIPYVNPKEQAYSSPDTLVLKRKIFYGDKKLKNMRELENIVTTINDAETMRLLKKTKTTFLLASVFIILGVLIGIILMIIGRSNLKKVVRRFNDVKMGRVKP